jgi:hypothetical protein
VAGLWPVAFPAVPSLKFLLLDQRLLLWRVSDRLEVIYESKLLPNNTAGETLLHNRERCEVLTGYLSLGRRPTGRIRDIGQNVLQSSF